MRTILIGIAVLVILFLAIQLIPYGKSHANPPVQAEPKWNSPQTRALAVRTCFDCHSNETTWPLYSDVAPFSWLIQHDVDEGRSHLNFSEWNRPRQRGAEAGRAVERGQMPQWYYVVLHPSASLSAEEKQALINGLNATFGTAPAGEGEGEGERR